MKQQAVGVLGASGCVGCGAGGVVLCAGCRAQLTRPLHAARVPGVQRVLTPLDYSGAARSLVLALKLRGRRAAAGPLAEAMSAQALSEGLEGSVITWVPGRRADTRVRGYDHARVLAEETGRRLGLPVVGLLRRAGHRRADQSALGRVDRWVNLEGAFLARRCGAAVVIVDDLVTTGATGGACGEALRNAGAQTVELLAACYVPSSQDAR
ncbi:MAG: ComF family protein [Actinomycetota bacterium]|nr:ComF family protein [Actinomycetota bacterium]